MEGNYYMNALNIQVLMFSLSKYYRPMGVSKIFLGPLGIQAPFLLWLACFSKTWICCCTKDTFNHQKLPVAHMLGRNKPDDMLFL